MSNQQQPKQRLPHAKRHILPIRLEEQDHIELVKTSEEEQRSMAFIAMRRYQAGLEIEKSKSPN